VTRVLTQTDPPPRPAASPYRPCLASLFRNHRDRYGARPGGTLLRTARNHPVNDTGYTKVWNEPGRAACRPRRHPAPQPGGPRDQLEVRCPVTFPVPSAETRLELSCTDLRDACLVLRTEGVVGNDVDADGKSLIAITCANSGGKSTFLRSAGLAQLMMQADLFVAAGSYRASVCTAVFTHFIREEDASMVSGRLDEELTRMSAIADQISPYCLMLFNESFAATNEREGSEIGRQVVRALLEARVRVLFVTHQFDFADSFYRAQDYPTLFLRAPRQSDGQRTFKLAVAEPLPTSYGVDLYFRIGGWLGESDIPSPKDRRGLPSRDPLTVAMRLVVTAK
jgi:hypothetical protein